MRLADVRAIRCGDVLVDGERWPGFLHVVEHPQGRVLVDTGLVDSGAVGGVPRTLVALRETAVASTRMRSRIP